MKKVPKSGFQGLKENWKDDLKAGFSVSLIALPLCLGIAFASGVPPMAGLITAIVGGFVVSRIGGAFVTISGPAAGLIVITLGAAQNLGGAGVENGFAGYEHALGAFLIGGLFVALFGLLKVGKFGDFFPPAAVHGMLAAIGVIIIIKQIYVAFGISPESKGIVNQLLEIPKQLPKMNLTATVISLGSLLILILHPFLKFKLVQAIPAPMWVLIFAVPMGQFLAIDNSLLVHLPKKIVDGITMPSFEKIGESAFWVAVTGVALVSGIESLLSTIAVDSQDPYKRKSNLNKDLVGVGIGSGIAGALGGLPMISEIVRSSANINNGAKTTWANFFHAAFLLLFLLVGKSVIELIPVSALATMLVYTGFRLASPKEFKHVAQIGKAQLLIFLTTLVMVLFTDLLIGIASGIVLKIIIHVIYGTKPLNIFSAHLEMGAPSENGNAQTIVVKGALIFSNYLSFKARMNKLIEGKKLINLDFSEIKLMDHTFQTRLSPLMAEWESNGVTVTQSNLTHLKSVSEHPAAAKILAKKAR